MGIEAATYISQLVSTNPIGASDNLSTADDHLRLIKAVLKSTFPNANAAVTATPTQMNYLVGVTSAIQTQINTKLASASYTAADVLTKIKTVDGAGSGLDADLLDGISSAGYMQTGDTADLAVGLSHQTGSAPSYAARAYGTILNDGSATVKKLANCTVAHAGTGLYTVSLTADMPDANYTVIFGTQQISGNPSITAMIALSTTPLVGSFQFEVTNTSSRVELGGRVCFAVFD